MRIQQEQRFEAKPVQENSKNGGAGIYLGSPLGPESLTGVNRGTDFQGSPAGDLTFE